MSAARINLYYKLLLWELDEQPIFLYWTFVLFSDHSGKRILIRLQDQYRPGTLSSSHSSTHTHTHVLWEYFKHTEGRDGQVVHQAVSSALSHSYCAFFFLSRSSVMQADGGIMLVILNTIISVRVAVHVCRLITCNSVMRCVYGFITLKCQKNFKESISRPLSLLCEMKQFV